MSARQLLDKESNKDTPVVSRKELRKQIRQRRNALSLDEQRQAGQALRVQVQNLIKNKIALETDSTLSLAIYLTNDGEIDTSPTIEAFREQEVQLLLPVLHPFRKGYLNFQKVNRHTKWTNNKYGIREPQVSAPDTIPFDAIDIICMPLVAFDKNGNRLGMGGGYYDRTLNRLTQINSPKPALIGLAHDCQEVDKLPFESWDVPIDYICTPTRVIRCGIDK